MRGLWNGIQGLAGWLWDRVSSWCSDIWDGILGFFGIHSPSKEMEWVGDMLTRGLAGGITSTGKRAVTAAEHMAADTLDAMTTLTSGLTVPLDTDIAPVKVPDLDLEPAPLVTHLPQAGTPGVGVDVAGIVESTAQQVLSGLDIKVVLNDGTLIGKLAPGLDRQLALRSRRTNAMLGGVYA